MPESNTPKDYTAYATKAPTALHESYKAWLEAKVGGDVALDLKTIQLAVVLYGDYQRSPERAADKAREDAQAAEKKALLEGKKAKATTTRQQRLHAKALEAAKVFRDAGIALPADIQAGIDALAPKVEPSADEVRAEAAVARREASSDSTKDDEPKVETPAVTPKPRRTTKAKVDA